MHRLFIGNVSYTATENEVRAAFVGRGYQVKSVTLVTDRESGQMRGFGFVEMERSNLQIKHIVSDMDGAVVDGRPLRVNEAQERKRD